MNNQHDLKGLGGWLSLVGIGLVLSPIRLLIEIIPMYKELFVNEMWTYLSSPDSPLYNPFWATLVIGEFVINLGILIVSFYLIYLYFSKKRIFPKIYIAFIVFIVIFLLADSLLIQVVMPDQALFDTETGPDFFRAVLVALIWIPYMLVSKRVKATFVE